MQSIMIVYNQVLSRDVVELLEDFDVRGFTRWKDVEGRGSSTGDPHLGTHTWPALNEAMLCVVDEQRVEPVLNALTELDEQGEDRGLRAFVWDVQAVI